MPTSFIYRWVRGGPRHGGRPFSPVSNGERPSMWNSNYPRTLQPTGIFNLIDDALVVVGCGLLISTPARGGVLESFVFEESNREPENNVRWEL